MITKQYKKILCDSCSVLVINNVICHERGCINAFKDELRECKECGCEFIPDNDHQQFCSDSCYAMYNGFNLDDEMEE
jgi:hypothetical protein